MNWKIAIPAALAIAAAAFFIFKFEEGKKHDFLELYGNVDVRQVDLGFRVPGQVTALQFEEGELIKPGTLVAQLDKQPYADQVIEAVAQLESAKVSFDYADKVLKRRQELISDGSVSQEDLDNARTNREVQAANMKVAEAALGIAQSNLSYTDVYAPTEGTILTRIREPGTVVNAGEPIYTLSVLSPVWIRAFCAEPDLGLIYPNMAADVYTDTPGGKVYRGHVGFISPIAEFTPKTVETTQLRTDLVYRLRIYVDNPDRSLRQGMPVTVRLYPQRQAQGSP
jgi:HlyD family secretion protein